VNVELRTDRFLLRSLRESDVSQSYVGWLNDPEVNRYLEVRFKNQTLDSVRAYVASHDGDRSFLLGIFAESGARHLGNYSLVVEPEHARATLGVMIGDREWWGEGVVLETRGAILDLCFDRLDVEKVSGACYATNRAAIYNYQRQGWRADGVRKAHAISEGRRVDVIPFAMFRADWRAKRATSDA
jgi:ribosomal-protein-alanine N-acetyltransferase